MVKLDSGHRDVTKPPKRDMFVEWIDKGIKELTATTVYNPWRHKEYNYFPVPEHVVGDAVYENLTAGDAVYENVTMDAAYNNHTVEMNI